MIQICRVCLRTDIELQVLNDAVANLFDELCDYESDSFAKFCSECVCELKKFQRFKERCQLATKIFKNWKKLKPPAREPPSNLSAKMPPRDPSTSLLPEMPPIEPDPSTNLSAKTSSASQLSLSTVKNCNIFYCQGLQLSKAFPSEVASSKYPHIVTLDVTKEVKILKRKRKSSSDKTLKLEHSPKITEPAIKVKMEDGQIESTNEILFFEEIRVDNIAEVDVNEMKKSIVNKDDELDVNDNGDDYDNVVDDNSDCKSDIEKVNNSEFNVDELLNGIDIKTAESSDDEVLSLKKFKKAKKKVTRKRKMTLAELANADFDVDEANDGNDRKREQIVLKKRGRKISLEELRRRLVKQFAHCGEVKDEEGNVIDTDVILDSLHSMPVPTLRQLKNQVSAGNGIKVLTPASKKLLAHLQKKYSNEYSNVFSVEHLGTRQQVLEEFAQRQHYESYTTAQYKCEECYTAFKSYKTLMYHKKACHNEKDPHVCTICSVRYNKEASLKWHYFSHRTVFKCKLCPFVTYQKHTMMLHYNIHAGVSYNCKTCEATFKSRSGLYLHMNTAHKTTYECCTCGRGFSTEYGLKVHQYMAHQEGELETSTCDICDKTFDNYEKYKRHVSYLHSEQLPDVLRSKKQKVEKGGRKHGVPNMFCPVCKKQLNSVGAMRWHFKVDHPNESFEVQYSGTHKHLCHECGKGFHALSELNDHKNLHTGAKPYSCSQCSATFYRKRNMTLHVLRHNPPSKECTLCGKKFRSGSNLYNHMRTHSGDRRYKCDICPKAFLHASALSAHTRGVHNHIRRIKKKSSPPIY